MADTADPLTIADRLFAAIESGDVDGVRELYADDVEIWHNHDQRVQTREQNLTVLRWLVANIDEISYRDIRRDAFAGGFVQQHVLTGRRKDGAPVDIPACIVVRIDQGRIVRLDEYLDSAHVAVLLGG